MTTNNALNNTSSPFDVDNIHLETNTISITDTNGTLTVSSNGTGAINIGTNATAHTTTLGSTNTTSTTRVQYGTGDLDMYNGTSQTFIMTDAGERTMPLQPAFLAYLGTTATNVTGDASFAGLGGDTAALTEVFDQGGDFTVGDGAGTDATFTAPVAGRYYFFMAILFGDLSGSVTSTLTQIATSNRNYFSTMNAATYRTSGNEATMVLGTFADMDALDTCTFVGRAAGTTKTIDFVTGASATDLVTFCSGYLAV